MQKTVYLNSETNANMKKLYKINQKKNKNLFNSAQIYKTNNLFNQNIYR